MLFCYKPKKMDNFLDDQFLCLLYLSYLLYPDRLCRASHTDGRNIESRFRSGKWNYSDVLYCGIFLYGRGDSDCVRYFLLSDE